MLRKTLKDIEDNFWIKFKEKLAPVLVWLINKYRIDKGDFSFFDYFDFWKNNGFLIIPNHFYQPIPRLDEIDDKIFSQELKLAGIDFREKVQISLLKNNFSKFQDEYNKFPLGKKSESEFHFNNYAFDGLDALVYYCVIRTFKPKTIIEVGSGWSTKIASKAASKNGSTKVISIEPYPLPFLKKGLPGLNKLIVKKVEDISLDFFSKLNKNDILFIDSSHVSVTGGDVNKLFLEVLPNLKKGVFIHIHDIFFPFDYPKEWVKTEHRFWNEQYLVQSFLAFNESFRVVFANNYMFHKHKKELKKIFPKAPSVSGGSLWIQRI